jgi:hypothetical protein
MDFLVDFSFTHENAFSFSWFFSNHSNQISFVLIASTDRSISNFHRALAWISLEYFGLFRVSQQHKRSNLMEKSSFSLFLLLIEQLRKWDEWEVSSRLKLDSGDFFQWQWEIWCQLELVSNWSHQSEKQFVWWEPIEIRSSSTKFKQEWRLLN